MAAAALLSSAAAAAAAAADSEMEILMEIKRGFKNPPSLASWNGSSASGSVTDWESPPVYCRLSWRGVSCDATYSVTSIALPNASLSGIISPSIASLLRLRHLNLSGNQISGTIPPQIAANLSDLDLSHNLISGKIPSSLFLAPSLQRLRLDGNLLSGEIPDTIAAASNLLLFSVVNNLLTGPIPSQTGSVSSLTSIYAGFNRLNGTLPESIGGLRQIQNLELQRNRIVGLIPVSWGNLAPTLRTLNLSDNSLVGQVPLPLLQSFTPSSFGGNAGLCYRNSKSNCLPVAAAPRPPPQQRQEAAHGNPRGGGGGDGRERQESYRRVEIIVGAVVGGVLLTLLVSILAYCWGSQCNRRRRREAGENWFNVETQEGRRQGKFAIFDQAIAKYGYEDFVSHAGFFDTAHVVGKGRFATVYRSDLPDGTQLAVKVFKYPIAVAAFEREMEAMAMVKHRFVLPIRAYYSDRVEKAVVYEYFPKGTLYELLHGEDESSAKGGGRRAAAELPDWAMRQRVAYGVAQALDYLHRCGVVHKDVQSRNVLLEGGSMLPRLADGGMVQVVSNRAAEEVVEKEGYTAPEVAAAAAAAAKYSEKSDVFGFGVVLLELITGKKAVMYVQAAAAEAAAEVAEVAAEVAAEKKTSLAFWAVSHWQHGKGREIMDCFAWKTCPFPEYMDTALKLAVSCVSENPALRPSMLEASAVLEGLACNPSPLKTPDLFSP